VARDDSRQSTDSTLGYFFTEEGAAAAYNAAALAAFGPFARLNPLDGTDAAFVEIALECGFARLTEAA
jgi:hypothetical protein